MPPREEVITSRSNPRVQLLRAAIAGHPRRSEGLIAVEGEHLLEEALRSGIVPRVVFLAGERPVPVLLPASVAVLRLAEPVFRSAVETEAPQGIAALLEPPQWSLEALLSPRQERPALLLVLAEVQDPGNVGTLLRSAEAFGADGVLLSAGSAHVWSGKALRASAGSAFRVPTARLNGAQGLRGCLASRVNLLATVGAAFPRSATDRETVTELEQQDLTQPVALMIGNEGAGLSRDWLEIADGRVTIPCSGPVESLNAAVAGAVMLYETQRQRRANRQAGTTDTPIAARRERKQNGGRDESV